MTPNQVPGYLGQAFDFVPGSTQHADAGVAMGTALGNGVSALTVSLWFNADITSGNDGLFYIGDFTTFGEFAVAVVSNKIRYRLSSNGILREIAFTDTVNWHNLVAKYTGSKIFLYLDGTKEIEADWSTNLNLSGLKTIIGGYFDPGFTFDGKIDQVRVFDRELTVPEIGWLSNEKVGPWIFRNGKAA